MHPGRQESSIKQVRKIVMGSEVRSEKKKNLNKRKVIRIMPKLTHGLINVKSFVLGPSLLISASDFSEICAAVGETTTKNKMEKVYYYSVWKEALRNKARGYFSFFFIHFFFVHLALPGFALICFNFSFFCCCFRFFHIFPMASHFL